MSWDIDKEETLMLDTVDISVAVATPNGLITPIIRNTNDKSITEISAELKVSVCTKQIVESSMSF